MNGGSFLKNNNGGSDSITDKSERNIKKISKRPEPDDPKKTIVAKNTHASDREDFTREPGLPNFKYTGETIILYPEDDQSCLKELIGNDRFLGLDTETKPVFTRGQTRPVALIQIAVSDKVILIRLKDGKLSPYLAEIIEDIDYVMTGFGLFQDFIDVCKTNEITPSGFIDLNILQKYIGVSGMQRSAAWFLKCGISKSKARSNWEARILKDSQIIYAATDAWISREVYLKAAEKHSEFLKVQDNLDFNILQMKLLMGRKNYRVLDPQNVKIILQALLNMLSPSLPGSGKKGHKLVDRSIKFNDKEEFFRSLSTKIDALDTTRKFSKTDLSGTTRILKSSRGIVIRGSKKGKMSVTITEKSIEALMNIYMAALKSLCKQNKIFMCSKSWKRLFG